MIKRTSNLFFLCALVVVFSCFNTTIEAKEFVAEAGEVINDIYVVDKDNNHLSQVGYLYVDGEVVYCIEPYKYINNNDILLASGSLDEKTKERLSLISFFGYNKEHTDGKWYAATQILIWEELGYRQTVYNFDDYSNYRDNILKAMKRYETLPSFANEGYVLAAKESLVLTDTNGVLEDYAIIESNNPKVIVTKNKNKLSITSTSNMKESATIKLQRFPDDMVGKPIVYIGKQESTQHVIKTQISKNVVGQCKVKIQPYGGVKFSKKGDIPIGYALEKKDNHEIAVLNYKESNLAGVKANVYADEDIYNVDGKLVYKKDELVETLQSSSNDDCFSKPLVVGKYYLQEIETLDDFILDNKRYEFTIVEDTKNRVIEEITIINNRSKIMIEFEKVMEESKYITSNPLDDVVVGIYTKSPIIYQEKEILPANQLVYVSKLDEKGHLIEQQDLLFGSYYLKELQTNDNYLLFDDEISFEVTGKNQDEIKIELPTLENKLKRFDVTVYKYGENKEPLIATFVILNNEFEEITTFNTNADGYAIVSSLPNGNYYLEEKEAPEGYKKLNKKQPFVIQGDHITLEIYNDKIVFESVSKPKVPNKKVPTQKAQEKKVEIKKVQTGDINRDRVIYLFSISSIMIVGYFIKKFKTYVK